MAENKHTRFRRAARKRYDELAAIRGEVCWICGNGPGSRRLHIDHDHKTLRVRGLACFRCNRALPAWVTAEWLRAAAVYLEAAEGFEFEVAA